MNISTPVLTQLKAKLDKINGEYHNLHIMEESNKLFDVVQAEAKKKGLDLEKCAFHFNATLKHVSSDGTTTILIDNESLEDINKVLWGIKKYKGAGEYPRYEFDIGEATRECE